MSITFYCPDAPRTTRPCPFCQEAVERGYDIDGHCDAYCDGQEEVSEAPECNFANVNALNILALLGLVQDYCGEIAPTMFPRLLQRLMVALNSTGRRTHLVEAAAESGGEGTGQCHAIYCGNTDEQTVRRLESFRLLVAYAKEHNYPIVWG